MRRRPKSKSDSCVAGVGMRAPGELSTVDIESWGFEAVSGLSSLEDLLLNPTVEAIGFRRIGFSLI